jgi:hypothetical protein
MDLIIPVIGLMHGQPVEVTGYMISGTGVSVPLVVTAGGSSKGCIALINGGILFIFVPASLG